MSFSEASSSECEESASGVSDFDLEVEGVSAGADLKEKNQHGGVIVPYADEPIASPEWNEKYNKRKEEDQELLEKLQRRLDGLDPVDKWCKCGQCKIERLQNPYECLCCQEIEKCTDALTSDEVLNDPEVDGIPRCITQHPGFRPICLERWTLKQAADKLRTRERKRYRQIDSEEAFLRSVSYREYVFMVYGRLGRVRQSLPACAYDTVRRTFSTPNMPYKGYEDNEDI